MEKIYNFYVLSSSEDEENIRYVGVTTLTVQKRFYGHKYCAKHDDKRCLPVHKWMYSHYQKGETIIVKQIDSCKKEEWEDRERYWISHYKELGFNLLNISKGGSGIVTKEMRSISSIKRSIKGHEKPIIALNKDGSFYKEYESTTKAAQELGLKNKSAINNVLKGRSKSSGGFLWVYKKDYDSSLQYSYDQTKSGTPVYQFDIDGILINEYPSKVYFEKLEGWSYNGINSAIKNKTVYHDSYWSESKDINLDEYEQYFYYQELNSNNEIVEMYRTQSEINEKFNLSPGTICTKIKEGKLFPNGNIISKL